MPHMLIPIVIFVACFGGGAVAAARLLPDLGPGSVAGLAFFAVCGLLAAALASAGLNIYEIVRELSDRGFGGFSEASPDLLAVGLRSLLLDSGMLFGLATAVYLLAPRLGKGAPDDRSPSATRDPQWWRGPLA